MYFCIFSLDLRAFSSISEEKHKLLGCACVLLAASKQHVGLTIEELAVRCDVKAWHAENSVEVPQSMLSRGLFHLFTSDSFILKLA